MIANSIVNSNLCPDSKYSLDAPVNDNLALTGNTSFERFVISCKASPSG